MYPTCVMTLERCHVIWGSSVMPYSDNPEEMGFMRVEEQLLHDVVIQYFREGWQVNVHAIGYCAHNVVLGAFEDALRNVNVSSLRLRLEYVQMLTPEDVIPISRLGGTSFG